MKKGNSVTGALAGEEQSSSLENANIEKIPSSKEIEDAFNNDAQQLVLNYLSGNDVASQVAYRSADAAVPGLGVAAQASGVKGNTLSLVTDAYSKLYSTVFGSPKPGNNAAQRKVLDKFTIPIDFDIILYATQHPDVVEWANKQGLNDKDYVLKQIAWHWFEHGKSAGWPYPYKPGYSSNSPKSQAQIDYEKYMAQPAVTKGSYDWVGGQYLDANGVGQLTGFHTVNDRPDLKQGDTVKITQPGFSGTFVIEQMGTDEGKYMDEMFVINIPRSKVPQVYAPNLGTWERVAVGNARNNSSNGIVSSAMNALGIQSASGNSNTIIYMVIVLLVLLAIAFFIYKKTS